MFISPNEIESGGYESSAEAIVLCQLDLRLKPELGFPLRVMHVNMRSALLAREEMEAETAMAKNRGAHPAILHLRHVYAHAAIRQVMLAAFCEAQAISATPHRVCHLQIRIRFEGDGSMTYRHTTERGGRLTRSKVAISLDESTLERLDRLVRKQVFTNRSQAIQEAVEEMLSRLEQSRLARECEKLDPAFEKALAEEGWGGFHPKSWRRSSRG